MALIQITDLTFAYPGSFDNVFEGKIRSRIFEKKFASSRLSPNLFDVTFRKHWGFFTADTESLDKLFALGPKIFLKLLER